MRDAQATTDDAGTDPFACQLDDLEANVVGKRTPVDEDATQLIDSALT